MHLSKLFITFFIDSVKLSKCCWLFDWHVAWWYVGGWVGRAPFLALKWNDDAVCGQESSWAQSVVIVSQQPDFFKVSLSDSLIFCPSAGREQLANISLRIKPFTKTFTVNTSQLHKVDIIVSLTRNLNLKAFHICNNAYGQYYWCCNIIFIYMCQEIHVFL